MWFISYDFPILSMHARPSALLEYLTLECKGERDVANLYKPWLKSNYKLPKTSNKLFKIEKHWFLIGKILKDCIVLFFYQRAKTVIGDCTRFQTIHKLKIGNENGKKMETGEPKEVHKC